MKDPPGIHINECSLNIFLFAAYFFLVRCLILLGNSTERINQAFIVQVVLAAVIICLSIWLIIRNRKHRFIRIVKNN